MKTALTLLALAATATVAAPARAALVNVEITGTVDFNQISFGAFGSVDTGDPVSLRFTVDSDDFLDSPSFPVRGYTIDHESFVWDVGPASVGLQDPYPTRLGPFFSIRDNDPAADGFLVSNIVDFPVGAPLDEPGQLGQFDCSFAVSYPGDFLDSLDILGALGTYDFTGLSQIEYYVLDGPFEAMVINYGQLTIELAAEPCADTNGDGVVNVDDLTDLISSWGACPGCAADFNGDNRVTVDDLIMLIADWGPCP